MELTLKCLLALFAVTGTVIAEVNDNTDVLVFGGTGRLGAPIVRLLIEAGYPVTVFARSTSDRGRLDGLDVTYIIGDLMDADSVDQAVRGKRFRFVIDATSRGSSSNSFYDTAMQNILPAVAASQVHQFILHGSVGAGDNMQNFPGFGFERMRDLMLAKGKAEALLKSSGLGYTIIRNGMVKRDGTPATGTARLTEDDSVLGAATRLDLAALTLQCLDNQSCMNKTFHAVDDSF
jgi:uncharacterized protein YbjT (DUF2867 family)